MAVSAAQPYLLDDFSTGAFDTEMILNNVNSYAYRSATGAMAGGLREVDAFYGSQFPSGTMKVNLNSTGLKVQSPYGVQGTVRISYTGLQGAPIDLSQHNLLRFTIFDLSSPVTAVMDFHSGGVTFRAFGPTLSSSEGNLDVAFNLLAPTMTYERSLDLTSIERIDLLLFNPYGGNYSVRSITTLQTTPVAEPICLVTIAAGVGSLLARRRQRI